MNGKYLYKIAALVISLAAFSYSQTNASGSLSDYVTAYTAGLPGADGNDYQTPSPSQRTEWENTILLLMQGSYGLANTAANNFGYRVVIFYDTTTLETYYILEKQSLSTNHWGMFVSNPGAKRSRLFIQAPHPKYDTYTDRQATYIFRYNSCRALFITGTHRCNSTTNTTCSGTSTVCGASGPYKISDQAHTVDGMLQVTTNLLNNNITNLFVIQPHGFTQGEGDPNIILSNGTRNTPGTDYALMLRDNLLDIDDTLTFKTAHIDLDWDRLVALMNTQGRLINNSSDPCSNNAAISSGRFIHLEQCYTLRNSTAARKKLSDAIGLTFSEESLVLLSPNGGESLNSGTTHNITWSSAGVTSAVQLEYSTDNGQNWVLISDNAPNTGTYAWAVPYTGTWKAKIRIADANFAPVADTSSSVFKILHSVYSTTGSTVFVDASSAFGPRLLGGVYDFHRGMDFDGAYNTPIRPSRAGVIVRMEDSAQTSGTGLERFGNWMLVRIDSSDGQPRHNAYLHLNGFHRFSVGDTVTTMDTVGFMGKSGYEINTVHLHLELYKNLTGTAIDKDKAKNPVELLPYSNSNSYQVNFIELGDSSAAEVISQDTELDLDGVVIYCTINDRTVEFNSRIGIDPIDNNNPHYNNVRIDPALFTQESGTRTIKFWVKSSESGTIDSVKIADVKGYSITISQSSLGQRYAVATGNWNGAIWATTSGGAAGSASVPMYLNDIAINPNITLTINISDAQCKSVSFAATTSKISFSSNSVLSIYGDFTLASTSHQAISAWTAGAKIKFTGYATQTLRGWSTTGFSTSFDEIIVDKSGGKVVTDGSNMRFGIGTSLEIINGTFELASTDDIEGRNYAGTAASPTITIQAGATFNMVGSLSHIRRASNTTVSLKRIGIVIVYGTANFRSTSSNGINFSGINVENGGFVVAASFSATSPNNFNPNSVIVKAGGEFLVTSSVNFWETTTPAFNLLSGGVLSLSVEPTYAFPPEFTNNGTIEYGFIGDQLIKTQSYNGLMISGGGNKTLAGDIAISGELNIQNGHLVTGINKVTLSSSATMAEAIGSMILGKVTTTRNVEQNVTNVFGGIGVEINAAGNAPGSTLIERETGNEITSNGNSSIKRCFYISPAVNNSLNASLVFHYDDSELNGISESNLRLFRASELNGEWSFMNGIVNTESNTITLSGIDGFSYWTAGNSESPLPVELSALSATVKGSSVNINWETKTEINSFMFEIQRMGSKTNWEKAGEVSASGNSNSPKEYSFKDENLTNGKYHYRLKIVDNDGKYKYSDAVDVNVDKPDKFAISQNYPNPFNPSTAIEYQIPERSQVTLKIFDILGNEVEMLVNEVMEAGYYKVNYFLGRKSISSGTYLCRLTVTGEETGRIFSEVKKMQLIK